MKKLITVSLVVALVAAGLLPAAQAATPKTLVIIDSGIAAELPWVKEMLVEEACFIQFGRCPNGISSMTGVGAAALPVDKVKDKDELLPENLSASNGCAIVLVGSPV